MKKILILIVLLPINIIIAQDINEGLIGYYPFNGNANNEYSNSHNGLVNGAIINKDKDNNPNSAYYFDGKDDFIQIKNSNDFNSEEMTISLWFKKNNSLTGKSYVDREIRGLIFMGQNTAHNTRRFSLCLTGQNPYNVGAIVSNGIDLTPVSKGKIIEPDKWYHTAITFDNNILKLYLNGELISSVDVKGNIVKIPDDVVIGKYSMKSHYNRFFDGLIDEVRIYKRILDDCEITDLYDYNPISAKQIITNYVESNLKKWSEKDEYESTDDFDKRLQEGKERKKMEFESEVIKIISDEIRWNCGIKKYNADNEEFELKYNKVEMFKLPVPKEEARDFGDNFDKLEYLNPEFKIGDKDDLIINCITIKNPVNRKEYKYGCDSTPPYPEIPSFTNSTVTVKIWDDKKEDGDIVSVFLNDVQIKRKVKVKKDGYTFPIELNKGINIFRLLAHNEGSEGKNTAAILINDGVKEYQTVLSCKKGESAEIKIIFK